MTKKEREFRALTSGAARFGGHDPNPASFSWSLECQPPPLLNQGQAKARNNVSHEWQRQAGRLLPHIPLLPTSKAQVLSFVRDQPDLFKVAFAPASRYSILFPYVFRLGSEDGVVLVLDPRQAVITGGVTNGVRLMLFAPGVPHAVR